MGSTNLDNATEGGVDVEAWAQQDLSQRMAAVAITSPAAHQDATVSFSSSDPATSTPVRGTTSLVIPLDADTRASPLDDKSYNRPATSDRSHHPRLKPRRDSQVRREALLKGKEGSRRRQKWENDRLLGNPWLEPPEPRDWEVKPTYPVHAVPYFLAPMWDGEEKRGSPASSYSRRKAARDEQEIVAKQKRRNEQRAGVTKDLRERMRKSRGAKGLLMDLEEQVRDFVRVWDEKAVEIERRETHAGANIGDSAIESGSDDEEIVFVGRGGRMNDSSCSPVSKSRPRGSSGDWEKIDAAPPNDRRRQATEKQLERDRLIFDSLVDDHGASFGRWLVHTIAAYYNLKTWSITTGNPERREAYVGIDESCRPSAGSQLPRPLWGLI